jgi:hypothetical protein
MPWLAAAMAAVLIFMLGIQVGTRRAERSAKSSAAVVAGDSPSRGPAVVLWY